VSKNDIKDRRVSRNGIKERGMSNNDIKKEACLMITSWSQKWQFYAHY